MELRKKKEIEYYDKGAGEISLEEKKESGSNQGFSPFLLRSYKFLHKITEERSRGKKILDYGCGTGVHLDWLAKIGNQVVGIDLSKNSLKIARERIKKNNLSERAEALMMDCEKVEFEDSSFDIVFDGGTFSSIDLKRAFPELVKVLKPNGFLIGIETFGHNPFTNLKRKINKLVGKRTEWAAEHIFQNKDLREAKKYFNKVEVYYFHLISWLAFPFLNMPGGKILLKILEAIEEPLLNAPFFKKYAFKVVFIFSEPGLK